MTHNDGKNEIDQIRQRLVANSKETESYSLLGIVETICMYGVVASSFFIMAVLVFKRCVAEIHKDLIKCLAINATALTFLVLGFVAPTALMLVFKEVNLKVSARNCIGIAIYIATLIISWWFFLSNYFLIA